MQTVAEQVPPSELRAVLFATAPLIVGEYAPAAATLSLDWFDEIRSEAPSLSTDFVPTPRLTVTDDDVAAMVARVTESLQDFESLVAAETENLVSGIVRDLEAEIQKDVAAGFWDTAIGNADDDPDARGWQRFARAGACKFCRMLAGRGSVYTRASVDFAAHTSCHCVVGPSYDPSAPKASTIQYVASRKRRSDADRARLRAYLNQNYPDAPG